jgi:hypothetical protein
MNCVCQNAPSAPAITDILRALERQTLCNGARCFEEETELFGPGRVGEQAAPSNTGLFFVAMAMLMAAAVYLQVNRPTPQLADKADARERRGDDDREPPAIQ